MKLTSHSSSWRLVILLGALLLASVIHAQEPTQEQFDAFMEGKNTSSEAVILADIGIYDATIVSKDNTTLTITFDIANNADTAQGDIKYGIDVIKASAKGQTIVDTLVANEVLTLKGHETQSKTITYTVPAFLSGEYEIWLISRTTGGLMLGLSSVGTTTFTQATPAIELFPGSCVVTVQGETETYTLYQGVDVAQEETLSLSCTVANPSEEPVTVTPVFETHRRTMYGELVTTPVSEETITLKGNEKKTIAFTIPKASIPQSYDVSMHLMDTETKQPLSNKIVAHYVLRGGSATIQTVTLDRDAYAQGDTLSARIFWSPSADSFPDARGGAGTDIGNVTLSLTVTNTDGTACTQPVTQSLNPTQMEYTIQAPVIAPCASPQASFTLTDATGNTLDSRTIQSPAQLEVATPTNTESPVTTPFWNMLTVAILLATLSSLIILFVVIQMLRHTRTTTASSTMLKTLILTVIVGASVFGGVQEVGAVAWATRNNNNDVITNFTVTANSATYQPSASITLSTTAAAPLCSNTTMVQRVTATLNGVVSTIMNSSRSSGCTSACPNWSNVYGTYNITAPTTPGTYTISLSGCVSLNGSNFMCAPSSITITVPSPTPVIPPAPQKPTASPNIWDMGIGTYSSTLSWPAVAGATRYLLRVDNTTGDPLNHTWNGLCGSAGNPNPGDFCYGDTSTMGSPSYPFTPAINDHYKIWVHACNGGTGAENCSPASPVLVMTPPPRPLTVSCPAPGTTATVSWAPVPNAVRYLVRSDNKSNPWSFNCSALNAGDYCNESLSGTSQSITTVAGGNYDIWVHSCTTSGTGYNGCSHASVPVANVTCTAPAPAPCLANTSKTWTVGGNTCTGSTGGIASGSNGTVTDSTAPTTGSAAYLCTNGSWAVSPNAGATCSVSNTINLTSSNLSVPASGTTGSALSFSATVSNIGNTTTGIGFSDDFTYRYGTSGGWTNITTITKSPLASGATSADNDSYTPTQTGTLYIQHCVDSANVIAESVEVPNCRVSTGIDISAPAVPPPPASCSNDTIDNCDVVAVSSGGTSGTCTIGGACQYTCTNGTWGENNNSCTIPQCNDGIDNDVPADGYIDFVGGDPDCSNASDNTESSVITPPDLTASPRIVPSGSSATISWDTNNGNETLCTLVGGTINSASTLGNGTGSAETGSVSFPVLARTTYTLTCPSGSDTLTVEIVPVGTET